MKGGAFQAVSNLRIVIIAGIAALAVAVAGCGLIEDAMEPHDPGSTTPMTHAPDEPAPPPATAEPQSEFFEHPELLATRSDLPFEKSWINPRVDLERYPSIDIAPVSVAYLAPMAPSEHGTVSDGAQREAALQAAIHLSDALSNALSQPFASRLHSTDSPTSETMVVNIAIVQLEPNRTAAPTAAPVMAGGVDTHTPRAVADTASRGTIGLEVKITAGTDGPTLAMFSDQRFGKPPPADAIHANSFGFVNRAIDQWSRDLIRTIDLAPT